MTATEIGQFLFDGPLRNLWPILLLPWSAAYLSRAAARTLDPFKASRRLAFWLTVAPGLVMMSLCLMAIGQALPHALGTDSLRHFLLYNFTPLLALAIVARATLRTWLSLRQVRLLSRMARPFDRKVLDAIGDLDPRIPLLELPSDEMHCFAAGLLRPKIFVSRGVGRRLDAAQLRACLFHEQAHVQSGDTWRALVIQFFANLAPNVDDAANCYREACERNADRSACRNADRLDLAFAMLALVRQEPPIKPACNMAMGATGARVHALLSNDLHFSPDVSTRSQRSALACALLMTFWPAPHLLLLVVFCTGN